MSKKQTKTYAMAWIDDEGNFHDLGKYETNEPKHTLFNEMCRKGIEAPNTFEFEYDKLMDNIKTGQKSAELGIEHYFVEADGIFGMQVLSLMEVKPKTERV